jgi:DNA-binding response OmpR family regulator
MILVVDDDREMTLLLRELLEKEGYEVRVAHDGSEAYRHLRDPKCKGMLLDMHMPGINGPELLLLMSAEQLPVPVIIITSDPSFEEGEMKQFANVAKLFHKPFYPEDILHAVRSHMAKPAAHPV